MMSSETNGERRRLVEEYAGDAVDELPVRAYAALILVYCGVFGAAVWSAGRRGALPRRTSPADLALLAIATHRLTRLLTRDKVASPLRLPFTRYEGSAGAGEVKERPRGTGLQRALGALVTCQFCAAPWTAAVLYGGLVKKPRETRAVAAVLTIVTGSDFLHQLYAWARRASA
jgi:hypothetical protein